jgi:hypothetical protein
MLQDATGASFRMTTQDATGALERFPDNRELWSEEIVVLNCFQWRNFVR